MDLLLLVVVLVLVLMLVLVLVRMVVELLVEVRLLQSSGIGQAHIKAGSSTDDHVLETERRPKRCISLGMGMLVEVDEWRREWWLASLCWRCDELRRKGSGGGGSSSSSSAGLGSTNSGLGRAAGKARCAGQVLLGTAGTWHALITAGFGIGAVLACNGGPAGDRRDTARQGFHWVSGLVVGRVMPLQEVSVGQSATWAMGWGGVYKV